MTMDEAKAILAGDAEQIMTGDVVPVTNRYGDCERCDGFGYIDGDLDGREKDCPGCGGSGRQKPPEGEGELVACPDCGGEVIGEWEVVNYCNVVLQGGRWVANVEYNKQDYDSPTPTRIICVDCRRNFTYEICDTEDEVWIPVPAKKASNAEP